MKQPTTENLFRDIVCDHFRVSPKQCRPETRFSEDLGADDLDPIELAMALEVEFNICFSDQEITDMSTYGKLLDLVKAKIAANLKEQESKKAEDGAKKVNPPNREPKGKHRSRKQGTRRRNNPPPCQDSYCTPRAYTDHECPFRPRSHLGGNGKP